MRAPRVSALAGRLRPGRHGTGEPGVRLSQRRLGALWQVTAWPDRLAEAGGAAARAAGVEGAPGPGRAALAGDVALMRTEPLRWQLAAAGDLAPPELAPEVGTLLDLSHARTVLRVEGPAAVDLMARMAPLDFRLARFPEGSVATSAIHHVAVTVLARGDGFDLFAYRSFGLALFDHLAESAEQFGLEIA